MTPDDVPDPADEGPSLARATLVRPAIFRAYDIRGLFNTELTAETAARAGSVFGAYLGHQGRVTIGRDARTSSHIMACSVAAGLAAAGVTVEDLGLVPIPASNFWTWQGDYAGGTYITASHNPAPFNGVRFRHPDGTGYTQGNEAIRELFFAGELKRPEWDALGLIERVDTGEVLAAYREHVAKCVGSLEGLKVALDPGNGAASVVSPDIFRDLGASVSVINEEPDGTFPNRQSNPTAETLGPLAERILADGADLGVGYDGDGDRCAFVDDRGRVLQAEKAGIIVAREVLKKRSGAPIVVNVPCSMVVEDEIEKAGGKVVRTRVGDVFVCEHMKAIDSPFAFEISAHYFAPGIGEYTFDDANIVAAKLAQIVKESGKSLSELSDEIASFPYLETKFDCADEVKFAVLDRLNADFAARGYRVDTTDGAKVFFDQGWALLRPSNTQPIIRMFVEARTEDELEKLRRDFTAEFERARAEVGG